MLPYIGERLLYQVMRFLRAVDLHKGGRLPHLPHRIAALRIPGINQLRHGLEVQLPERHQNPLVLDPMKQVNVIVNKRSQSLYSAVKACTIETLPC